MKKILAAFLVGLLVMAGAIRLWPKTSNDLPPVDEPPSTTTTTPTKKIITIAVGEVVNSIRGLNRLIVFQAYVTARTTTHEIGWFTTSDQTMLTPAFVNYYVDMDKITTSKISVKGNDVYVPRPAIMIERPNIDTRQVVIFNSGAWTSLTSTSDRMRVANSKMALKQLLWRAKMPFLAEGAERATIAAVNANIHTALAAAGHPEVVVHIVS